MERTSITVRRSGLNRESSYSSSADGFCLIRFLRSLSPGPYKRQFIKPRNIRVYRCQAHPADPHAEVNERVDSVLLW